MDWVKLATDYFRDKAIVLRSDAHEVMFCRGLAIAGEMELSGFLPDEVIPDLARNKRTAKRLAKDLASAPHPVWERVTGGYQIVNWDEWQKELEKLVAKKERERQRKRRKRAEDRAARTASADAGADGSADCPVENEAIESKSESKTAAAAAVDVPATELTTDIAILRSKLQAHTRLQALRFDGLTPEKQLRLQHLINVHGDDRLVQIALDTCRATPPVHVTAFVGTWEALPEPGTRLKVIQSFCTDNPHHANTPLTPSGVCRLCQVDAKVGDR